MAQDSYSPLAELKRSGVARRRKVGGGGAQIFFPEKSKAEKKGKTKNEIFAFHFSGKKVCAPPPPRFSALSYATALQSRKWRITVSFHPLYINVGRQFIY